MTRIKKSEHKTIPEVLREYRSFVQMALGGSKNFITHPKQDEYRVGNEPNDRRVLKLIPTPYIRVRYEVFAQAHDVAPVTSSSPGVTQNNYLTKAAYDLFKDLKPDLIGKLDEARDGADDVFADAPYRAVGWGPYGTVESIGKATTEVEGRSPPDAAATPPRAPAATLSHMDKLEAEIEAEAKAEREAEKQTDE